MDEGSRVAAVTHAQRCCDANALDAVSNAPRRIGADHYPTGGLDSTKFWKPGELVADDFDIPIPTDVLATLPTDQEDFSGPLGARNRRLRAPKCLVILDETYRGGESLVRRAACVGGRLVVTERYDLDGHTGSPCLSSGPPGGSLFIQMHAVILAR
jgi:hypothetical protein